MFPQRSNDTFDRNLLWSPLRTLFSFRERYQGYKGRMRLLRLAEVDNVGVGTTKTKPKRDAIGVKKHPNKVYINQIPILPYHVFHTLSAIQETAYNVPDRKNFSAVDSIAPSRGEMYQITSAGTH